MLALAIAVSLLAVAGFAAGLWKTHVFSLFNRLSSETVEGITAMFDTTLDDDAKEKAVRAAGFRLIFGAWQIIWRFGVALAAAALPIILADLLGLVSSAETLGVMLRVDFIVIVSVVAMAIVWLLGRRKSATEAGGDKISGAGAYGGGDRMMHSLAFSGPGMLRKSAAFDDRLFAKTIKAVPEQPPVFITSLARGGTTALLNAMHGLPQIATHQYRDMPFISAPLTWSKISGKSRNVTERERAHGDGMRISLDSPEAFDEIFWMLFWPEKYSQTGIGLWRSEDEKAEAQAFFRRHFQKIVALRHPEAVSHSGITPRYLSKNNANIARLRLLPQMFPGCDVIVPLRGPAAHAASLIRQHQNFTKMHAEDPFVKTYMRDIGHLEFGELHRPIQFGGFPDTGLTPDMPDYWLTYWISAFEDVRDNNEGLHIVAQDSVRADPQMVMEGLLERINLPADRDFREFFRQTPDPQPEDMFSPALMAKAKDIYRDIETGAVGH